MPACHPSPAPPSAFDLARRHRRLRRPRPAGRPRAAPAWSAPTAPASPRCCDWSPASCSPTAGSVSVAGEVGYLPQDLTLDRRRRVDESSASRRRCGALRAVEAGDRPTRADFDGGRRRLGRRGARRSPSCDRLGLPADVLDRRLGELSGGEVDPARAGAAAAAPPGRAAARRADQQPRRRGARRGSTTSSGPGAARCSWSATTASCSSGWTGSATCATARCAGTAAATRRTPTRSRPSRRPPSRR